LSSHSTAKLDVIVKVISLLGIKVVVTSVFIVLSILNGKKMGSLVVWSD
jgi:hypothetical protein